jgi:hypothetical protein
MKYILLMMFFTTPDGSHWALQNTASLELDTDVACQSAGAGIWSTFEKTNGINMIAWCMPKGATQISDIKRLEDVGQKKPEKKKK